MLAIAGLREGSKSVWAYADTGGASPSWSADTGGATYGVAIDSSDNVYAVGENVGSKNLWKFNSSGTLVGSYNAGGSTAYANCVALDSAGRIIVGHDAVSGVCFTRIAADLGSDVPFTSGLTGDFGLRVGITSTDSIMILVLAANSRGVTTREYNSSLAQLWTNTNGVGADIIFSSPGLVVHSDGDMSHAFQYSTVRALWHTKGTTGAGDGNDLAAWGNELKGFGIDANDFIWLGTDALGMEKWRHDDGDDFYQVLDVAGEDIYSNIYNNGTITYVATWGAGGE